MRRFFDVDQTRLIENTALELEKEQIITPLPWASFVKTGMSRERPPVNRNWWYVRAAAILRKILILGPIGTEKLRVKYGSRKNRGNRPEKFFKASGNIIRKILQQLEAANFIKQEQKGNHKGRVITKEGKELLDKVANGLLGDK
tara:strand:- start:72 stop:503 length:432 start_codon:yes stop_codon:yes gene_type:complete